MARALRGRNESAICGRHDYEDESDDDDWIYPDDVRRQVATNGRKLPNLQLPRNRTEKAAYAAGLADDLNKLTFENNHRQFLGEEYSGGGRSRLPQERNRDTVAVGISHNGHDVTIAGNVKQRTQFKNRQWQATKDSTYGFQAKEAQAVTNLIREKYPELKSANIKVVGPKNTPTNVRENAAPHAEMQLLSRKDMTASHSIGISKPPCEKCTDHLSPAGVKHAHAGGEGKSLARDKVKNFDKPEEIQTKTLYKVKPRDNPNIRVNHNMQGFKANPVKAVAKAYIKPVIKTPAAPPKNQSPIKKVGAVAKQHVNANIRPNVGVSMGSGLENIINDWDHPGSAYAATDVAEAGSYETRCSTGVYARASTVEAGAKWSVFSARANGPAAAAGLHSGVGTWAAAYANAEVARAEASAGPLTVGVGLNANTGASIGLDGVSASFLGFGFSLGPRMGIRTPIFNISLG